MEMETHTNYHTAILKNATRTIQPKSLNISHRHNKTSTVQYKQVLNKIERDQKDKEKNT